MFALQFSFVEFLVSVQFAAIAYLVLKLQKVRRAEESGSRAEESVRRAEQSGGQQREESGKSDDKPQLVDSSESEWSEVQAAPKLRKRSKRDKAPSGHIIVYRKKGSSFCHSKYRCCTRAVSQPNSAEDIPEVSRGQITPKALIRSSDVEMALACKTCMKGCYEDDEAGR